MYLREDRARNVRDDVAPQQPRGLGDGAQKGGVVQPPPVQE